MRFMMVMISAVCKGLKPALEFPSDPKKVKNKGQFNEELDDAFDIESLSV
jgi:hypothetical protein